MKKQTLKGLLVTTAVLGAIAVAGTSGETVHASENVWVARTVEQVESDINGDEYTIIFGDTLSVISQATNITIDKLASLNAIDNIDLIFAGNKLTFGKNSVTIENTQGVVVESEIKAEDKINPAKPVGQSVTDEEVVKGQKDSTSNNVVNKPAQGNTNVNKPAGGNSVNKPAGDNNSATWTPNKPETPDKPEVKPDVPTTPIEPGTPSLPEDPEEKPEIPWTPIEPGTPVEPEEKPEIPWTPIEPGTPVEPEEKPEIPWTPIEPGTPVEPEEKPEIPWTPIEPGTPVEPEEKPEIPWTPIEPGTPVDPGTPPVDPGTPPVDPGTPPILDGYTVWFTGFDTNEFDVASGTHVFATKAEAKAWIDKYSDELLLTGNAAGNYGVTSWSNHG